MAKVSYDKQLTALLVIDPYNDFISDGGKLWDRRTIRTDDIITIIDTVARNAPTTAHRVQTVIASVFSWAVRERIVASNPREGYC